MGRFDLGTDVALVDLVAEAAGLLVSPACWRVSLSSPPRRRSGSFTFYTAGRLSDTGRGRPFHCGVTGPCPLTAGPPVCPRCMSVSSRGPLRRLPVVDTRGLRERRDRPLPCYGLCYGLLWELYTILANGPDESGRGYPTATFCWHSLHRLSVISRTPSATYTQYHARASLSQA